MEEDEFHMNASPRSSTGISVGLAHELCLTAQRAGFTPEELNDLVKNEGRMRELRDVHLGRALIKRLRCHDFPLWKTIALGRCRNAEEYRRSLDSARCSIGQWGKRLLEHQEFACSDAERYVDIVIVTVKDLGFDDMERYSRICERAVEEGLELCPIEAGPAMRLAYLKQPLKEAVLVGMKGVFNMAMGSIIFSVENDERKGLRLDGHVGDENVQWPCSTKFAFVRPLGPSHKKTGLQ